MSFTLTTDQVRNKTKTVTRRFAWDGLKPGTKLNAVNKCMGLRKGEKPLLLANIRVVSVRREPLNAITQDDCARRIYQHANAALRPKDRPQHNGQPN